MLVLLYWLAVIQMDHVYIFISGTVFTLPVSERRQTEYFDKLFICYDNFTTNNILRSCCLKSEPLQLLHSTEVYSLLEYRCRRILKPKANIKCNIFFLWYAKVYGVWVQFMYSVFIKLIWYLVVHFLEKICVYWICFTVFIILL